MNGYDIWTADTYMSLLYYVLIWCSFVLHPNESQIQYQVAPSIFSLVSPYLWWKASSYAMSNQNRPTNAVIIFCNITYINYKHQLLN